MFSGRLCCSKQSLKVVGDGNRYNIVFLNRAGRATHRFLFPGCYASAVQSDGRVLIAGVGSNSVVRLNEDGTFDTVFDLLGSPNGLVSLLAVGRNEDVLLAGMFSEIGNTSRRGLARVFGTAGRVAVAPRIEDWAVEKCRLPRQSSNGAIVTNTPWKPAIR